MQLGGTHHAPAPPRPVGADLDGQTGDRADHGVGVPGAAVGRRVGRRAALPSGRALVGGLVVAVSMVGAYLVATGGDAPRGRVVVASRPLPIGHQLGLDDLRVEPVDVPDALASATFANPDDLVGTVTVAPLTADEIVGRSAVVELGPDGPAGRTLSFPVDLERAGNGHLLAGDQVDVLATYGTGTTARTTVVARRVRVLDLERAGSSTLGSNGRVVVTVSLTDGAEVLATAHAAEVAAITLVRSTGTDGSGAADGPDSYGYDPEVDGPAPVTPTPPTTPTTPTAPAAPAPAVPPS